MFVIKVHFICPQCGAHWDEYQESNDEWYKLATRQTLCEDCGRKAIEDVLKRMEKQREYLSSRSCSDNRSGSKETNGKP